MDIDKLDKPPWFKGKGKLLPGALLIAYGVITAITHYFDDIHSFEMYRMDGAVFFAIVHLFLYGAAGGLWIWWFWPADSEANGA
jgi:hypothetical protein